MNIEPKAFAPGALEALVRYPWPGNARQLENEVKRLIASVRGKAINEDHLDPALRTAEVPIREPTASDRAPAPEASGSHSLPVAVEALERRMIEEALRQTAGNKQKAAQVLGLSRQGLIKKLKRLGLSV